MVESKEKTKAVEGPEVLELILETRDIEPWEPTINIDGRQIAGASDAELQRIRDNVEASYEREIGDKIFCEIAEVQKILKARPVKRDKDDKPILQRHPQLGIDTVVWEDYSIDEQRPRNRILWAISDQLKGRNPKDVKKITVGFHVTADLKQPKWEDAEFLAKLVKYATDEHPQLGYWIVEFADKFLDETEGLEARAAKLIKTK